ncbi:hypothetical protein SLEP1_g14661 [Rubroshorea leprosula]|uniref:Uncharacterized protein n=1 Tax=Rubroshorea leprosula TaxID=152421 RepID=A0AAV5IQV6_9ROSI|nr:hypothetical protein SLEP1_g14661 [Rubroshorea leprosula]
MLESSGFSTAQACWSRLVLPPPMTIPDLSAFGSLFGDLFWRPSVLSYRSWEVLADFSDLATAELDLCRDILEISRHPLRSRLKGVPWIGRPQVARVISPPFLPCIGPTLLYFFSLFFSLSVTLILLDKD